MSEVAKVREALERLVPCLADHQHDEVCARYTRLETAFVAHGLKVCDRYDATMWDKASVRNLDLIAAILRDAGLLEG